jgi:hypothetical protein
MIGTEYNTARCHPQWMPAQHLVLRTTDDGDRLDASHSEMTHRIVRVSYFFIHAMTCVSSGLRLQRRRNGVFPQQMRRAQRGGLATLQFVAEHRCARAAHSRRPQAHAPHKRCTAPRTGREKSQPRRGLLGLLARVRALCAGLGATAWAVQDRDVPSYPVKAT